MSLSPAQQATYDTLLNMGFPSDLLHRAALKFNSNIEGATDWVLSGGSPPSPSLDNDDAPPPLISIDNDDDFELPHPSTVGMGPTRAQAQGEQAAASFAPPPGPPPPPPSYEESEGKDKKLLPAPFAQKSEKSSIIDLTNDDPSIPLHLLAAPPSSPTARLSGDDDLARALAASKNDSGGGGADDDLSKAMALSMATIGSADEEGTLGVIESIAPQERVREDLSIPPTLRSTSAHQSGLAAYLQCLFAVPTWRNAILSYRTPDRATLSGDDYKDYWRGDGGLAWPMPLGETEARENRLIALQRLFALMTLTRRSFLHITEVTRAFGLRESEFITAGVWWPVKIKEIHEQIVEDLRLEAGQEAARLLELGASEAEAAEFEKAANNRFTVRGRAVPVDAHISAPLPPAPQSGIESSACISLSLNPTSPPPGGDNLFTLLDRSLVSTSSSTPLTTTLHMMINSPATLLVSLERQTAFTSLDTFGSGTAKAEKKLFNPTPPGQAAEEDIWLDRYHVKNRKVVAEGRKEIEKLEGERESLRGERETVGTTKGGEDVREVLRGTVEVLRREAQRGLEEGGEGGEEGGGGEEARERRERQERLREGWEKVGVELESVLASYDTSLTTLSSRISSILAHGDNNELYPVGPFRLSAILMRNGLNGRGSAWSVVRGGDGRWWKVVDLVKEEITLEKALEDPSGLMMDAGSTFLLYQRTDVDFEPAAIPAHLERIAHLDNHDLASSLPASPSTAALVASWALPPLSDLAQPEFEFEAVIPFEGATEEDDAVTVRDIELDDNEGEAEEIRVGEQEKEEVSGAATPMSVDSEGEGAFKEKEEETAEAMRLRGGAGVSIEDEEEEETDDGLVVEASEDEEEYDDDEIDEDEVELGLLAPMPETWDVDYAVGKVGGKPVWLDPRSPLDGGDVECGRCGRVMSMLLQVNAPDDTRPHAAARSLYLFLCRGKDCLSRGGAEQALQIWRTQMESPNAFYPHTEETLRRRKELEEGLDEETGLGGERGEKGNMKVFPEFDVQPEEEPYEESYLPDESTPATEKDGGVDEDAADTKVGVDRAFLTFQERISREPKQVLRFYRLPNVEDPQPLWASATKIRPEEIPPCELCRGERKVEFQVLSTLLPSLDDSSLDFDSLLVYTCINHCAIPSRGDSEGEGKKTGWAREVVFKQEFAAEGVKFGQNVRRQ